LDRIRPHILCLCLVLCAAARAADAPPFITNASPNPIDAGGPYFLISINGSGFVDGAVVKLAGSPLNTTFVSATELKAAITTDLRAFSGVFYLTVTSPNGMGSSSYPIVVSPVLAAITPAAVLAGSPAVTITAKGIGFTRSEVLVLKVVAATSVGIVTGQSVLSTSYVDSATLIAVIPGDALAVAGILTISRVANIQVQDPLSGITSGLLPFGIRTLPAIVSATPSPIDAGGPFFQLTVTGTSFVPDSTVIWAGSRLATTFVSPTKLQAAITPDLRSVSGTFNLTVGDSTGATSNSYPITVSPVLFSISPAASVAAGPPVTITATGVGFTSNSVLLFQQSPLATTYLNPTTLSAVIPSSALRTAGSASIQVADTKGVGHSLPQPFTISPPVPIITSLSPGTTTAGAATFLITVNGTNFVTGATVQWNGSPLATTFVSATQLTAYVPPALVQAMGSASITASNSGGAVSNSLTFAINLPPPTIAAVNPASAIAGSAPFTLTVTGINCAPGIVVQWNRLPLATTLVSATQVTAFVPSNLYNVAGVATITLADRNGAVSNQAQFTIYPAPAILTSLSPNAATEGVATFTLTVNGNMFVPGATVLWNGSQLATTFVSPTQLTALVPASVSNPALSATVTVTSPGGAVSNILIFTIDPLRPIIYALSPASATLGSASFTLTATGVNFATSCVLRWNGSPLSTTFASATQATATVPANLVAAAGAAIVTLINPSGVTSNTATFPITTQAPTVTSIAPASVAAGGPAFTLTVRGSGFLSGAVVEWNGSPLVTTLIDATQLTAFAPASAIAGPGVVTIAVALQDLISNSPALTITPPLPATTTAGVVNTISLLPLIAPGSLISIYGVNLAAGDATAPSLPLPGALNGTSVTINGNLAPLVFVSATQINAQTPYETKEGTATLLIQAGSVTSAPVKFQVVDTAPAVVTTAGSRHAMAQNDPDAALNTPDNPAQPGQSVTVFLTGQGVLDNPVPNGAVPPDSPISAPLAAIQAQIGGKDASISFAGLAAGFVGLLRLDIIIPDVPAGEQPLEVAIGGVSANSTMVSIVERSF
jgi:uncharacterized protein (TIGR03437 family)